LDGLPHVDQDADRADTSRPTETFLVARKQMVAVRLKNELKKQGVTARVWSGMVLVKI